MLGFDRFDRLVHHRLAGPVLTSCLALLLLGARIGYTRRLIFFFLAYNLFLAWTPYFFTLVAPLRRAPTWVLGAIAVPWVLLFPNAPYLVTDLIHLQYRSDIAPLWFDAAMFASFACAGLLVGARSLELADELVRDRWGKAAGWTFVTVVTALTGFGIYLGRFVRFNSWDAMLAPSSVLDEASRRFATEPFRVIAVSAVFGALTLVAYIALKRGPAAASASIEPEPAEKPRRPALARPVDGTLGAVDGEACPKGARPTQRPRPPIRPGWANRPLARSARPAAGAIPRSFVRAPRTARSSSKKHPINTMTT